MFSFFSSKKDEDEGASKPMQMMNKAKEARFMDYEAIKDNAAILSQLGYDGPEEVIFSSQIHKVNKEKMFNQDQKRIFLLTNKNLCNLKDTSIQRKIEIEKLRGLTMSTKAK